MAIYSLSIHSIKVGGGRSIIAHAAYISKDQIRSDRTGLTSDYRNKSDVEYSEFTLPEGTPEISSERFWNMVESDISTEGANYAKQGHIALPLEWSLNECQEYGRQFIRENFTDKGHPTLWAIHNKEGNPHIDFLVSQKRYNEKGQLVSPPQKKVYANDRDENGKAIYNPDKPSYDFNNKETTAQYRLPVIDSATGEQKFRERKGKGREYLWERVSIIDDSLNSKSFLLNLRQNWQDLANQHLAPDNQIDCRSLKAQGIDREPQIHVGAMGYAIEDKNPGESLKFNKNEGIKQRNKEISTLQRLAREFADEMAKVKKSMADLLNDMVNEILTRKQKVFTLKPAKQSDPIRDILKKYQKAEKEHTNEEIDR